MLMKVGEFARLRLLICLCIKELCSTRWSIRYVYSGVMDSRTGVMVIPAIYTDINMISEDLIMAEIDGDEACNILYTVSGVMVK